MLITQVNTDFHIAFRYCRHLVEAVKNLPSRRYDPVNKFWVVPTRERAAVEAFARRYGFRMGDQSARAEMVGEIPPMPELQVEIPLAMELYHYQKQGVAYCLEHPHTIIGDKPGLGKTAQSIAAVIAQRAFPCLIIAPATLKINWAREVKQWGGDKMNAIIINDKNRRTWHLFYEAGMAQFFVVNYESLKKYFVEKFTNKEGQKLMLSHIKFRPTIDIFKSVIIDESHRCKNGSAQQSKFCMGISKEKPVTYLLSGTPLVNKPKDLIPQLHIMGMLSKFGGYKYFVNRYCSGPNEASNLRELNYLLNLHCFYQRAKEDVLKDLPAKTRQTILCDITNRKEYMDAERDLIKYLREYRDASDEQQRRAKRGEVIVRINVLRQICARGKVKEVKEFIDDLIESGEKLILFMNLIELGDAFKKLYPDAVVIRGGMSAEDKQRSVDLFQHDPICKLAICNIKAAGVGLTLTASSRVAFVEFPWTYADCEQCEDRAHRIGQKNNVSCYYFLGEKTIDEDIYKIIQTKKSIAQTVTGTVDQVEENVVDAIMNIFNQK